MNRNLIFGIVGALSAGLIGLFFYGIFFASNPKEIPSAQIGGVARDFTISNIFTGEKITLSQFKGRPVVVNFWASWCVSCRQEAHLIEAANRKYTPLGGVFIGVAINDTPEAAMGFIRRYGKSYLLGLDDEIGTISLDYGVTAVPETFFVGKDGTIKHKALGAVTGYDIEEFMQRELGLASGSARPPHPM